MDNTVFSLLVISSGGAFGGIVLGLTRNTSYQLKLPGGKSINLGFVGDALIGFAASIAVFAFASPILNIDFEHLSTPQELFKALAISLLSGFCGISALNKLSNNFLDKIETVSVGLDNIKELEKSKEYSDRGWFYTDHEKFSSALIYFDQALNIHPENSSAFIGKAYVLKRQGNIQDAFDLMGQLIKVSPEESAAYYNRSCYGYLLKQDKALVLKDLSKAINLFPGCKAMALEDPDFGELRNDPEFKQMVNNV